MNIVLVEPSFPQNQRRFAQALAGVGANVIGVGEASESELGDELRGQLVAYYQVSNVTDVAQLNAAVEWAQDLMWIDGLESTIESHQMAAAQVREARGIPGTSVHTTWLCRDKPSMKEALRRGGSAHRCLDRSTHRRRRRRVRQRGRLPAHPQASRRSRRQGHGRGSTRRPSSGTRSPGSARPSSIAVEEFVEGHEGFYDTIAIGGHVVHDWMTHYYPNVLEAMRHRWISPQFVTTNRIEDSSSYGEVREIGRRVIKALGIPTSATHMEWFYGPKGLRFSEIGCRPPGVGAWDLYSAANDVDVYREWAHAIVHGSPENTMSRQYSAGIVALRPEKDGQIHGYSGLEEINDRHGQWIIDAHLPDPGTPTQPVDAGYMANAYIRMRHPDYDTLRGMLDDCGRTVRVHAG